MANVWFTSDLHFGHKNILKHCPDRILEISNSIGNEEISIEKHDNFLIDRWNKTVSKNDTVYILGDFSFLNTIETKKLLAKLNGNKHLILGNHDKSSENLYGYFKSISQIKEIKFKKVNWDFLDEDIIVICCHFPMITWDRKEHGTIHVHGHTHGRLDEYNMFSDDLRVDVGIDGLLSNFNLISLKTLYNYFFRKKFNQNKN